MTTLLCCCPYMVEDIDGCKHPLHISILSIPIDTETSEGIHADLIRGLDRFDNLSITCNLELISNDTPYNECLRQDPYISGIQNNLEESTEMLEEQFARELQMFIDLHCTDCKKILLCEDIIELNQLFTFCNHTFGTSMPVWKRSTLFVEKELDEELINRKISIQSMSDFHILDLRSIVLFGTIETFGTCRVNDSPTPPSLTNIDATGVEHILKNLKKNEIYPSVLTRCVKMILLFYVYF